MNPASTDIATLLAAEASLSLTKGTNLFASKLPDKPDNCVAVFDNPGSAPLLTLRKSTSAYYNSSVTIQSRNIDYANAWSLIFDILTFLHGTSDVTEASTYYALIRALEDPQLLYWDGNDRALVFVNFEVQRR